MLLFINSSTPASDMFPQIIFRLPADLIIAKILCKFPLVTIFNALKNPDKHLKIVFVTEKN